MKKLLKISKSCDDNLNSGKIKVIENKLDQKITKYNMTMSNN